MTRATAGLRPLTFTITKNGSTSQTTSVNWATANGTAIAPEDFAAVSSTPVTFLPGDTSKQVTVLVNGDSKYRIGRDIYGRLKLARKCNDLRTPPGTGTITNDDTAADL